MVLSKKNVDQNMKKAHPKENLATSMTREELEPFINDNEHDENNPYFQPHGQGLMNKKMRKKDYEYFQHQANPLVTSKKLPTVSNVFPLAKLTFSLPYLL